MWAVGFDEAHSEKRACFNHGLGNPVTSKLVNFIGSGAISTVLSSFSHASKEGVHKFIGPRVGQHPVEVVGKHLRSCRRPPAHQPAREHRAWCSKENRQRGDGVVTSKPAGSRRYRKRGEHRIPRWRCGCLRTMLCQPERSDILISDGRQKALLQRRTTWRI